MQFGAYSYAYSTNLGDEIQTLAAMRFLPRVDLFIERDRMNWYRDADPIFIISNGWFTRPHSWPPPDSISPLFVAFHANAPELLIDRRYVDYFKRHEPIGCRNIPTMEAFRKIGIDAYFSACLTLTTKMDPGPRTDEVLLVDVEPDLATHLVPAHILEKAARLTVEFPAPGNSLGTRVKWNTLSLVQRGIYKTDLGRTLFSGPGEMIHRSRNSYRQAQARELLRRYGTARLVITSRLHCALPCLALGTPVVLLRPGVESDPRFHGLRELVRYHNDPSRPVRINWEDPGPNPDLHLRYVRALTERCQEVVSQVQKTGRVMQPSLTAAEVEC